MPLRWELGRLHDEGMYDFAVRLPVGPRECKTLSLFSSSACFTVSSKLRMDVKANIPGVRQFFQDSFPDWKN